jgi:hypothetical protein
MTAHGGRRKMTAGSSMETKMRSGLPVLLVLLAVLAPGQAMSQDAPGWVADSREAARQLGSRLMAELTTALATSPAAAIRVCSERAPAIAAEVSAATGATVGRTAARYRNPSNAPAGWQQRGLEYIAGQLAAGAAPGTIEFTEVAVLDGGQERRWMKPIMTAPLCLGCHGTTLAPEVATAIGERYPDDLATGFAAGDLRGAFYVTWQEPKPE